MWRSKKALFLLAVVSLIITSQCAPTEDEEKKDDKDKTPSPAELQTPTALFKCADDQDLKNVEDFLENNDSVEEHVNCIVEDWPPCSGSSDSKCCDNVGTKLKDIGLIVFGPRSSVKECGLLDQECRCQRRTAAKIARTFAVKFSPDFVQLQAHYKGSETETSSAASRK